MSGGYRKTVPLSNCFTFIIKLKVWRPHILLPSLEPCPIKRYKLLCSYRKARRVLYSLIRLPIFLAQTSQILKKDKPYPKTPLPVCDVCVSNNWRRYFFHLCAVVVVAIPSSPVWPDVGVRKFLKCFQKLPKQYPQQF